MNTNFPSGNAPIKLFGLSVSGHAHRAELMLALLDLPYEKVDVDLMNGAHKADDFLALNPFGQIPVIDDNGQLISDSTAILVYLAKKYGGEHAWIPNDPVGAADVQPVAFGGFRGSLQGPQFGPSREALRTAAGL